MGTTIPNIGSSAIGDPIGKAVVEIIADDKAYQQGLKKGEKSLELFDKKTQKIAKRAGKAFLAAGTAIGAALTGVIFHAAKAGDELDKMSLRTGISVENLSRLTFAAERSGSDIRGLETSLRFLSRRMDEASQGIGIAVETFDDLGITLRDQTGQLRAQPEVIKDVAEAIKGLESETKQVAVAMDIFGARSGPGLLPLLKQGEAGIQELMDRADELGIVMSTQAATASAEFSDRMLELRKSLSMAAFELGQSLLPAAERAVVVFTDLVAKFNKLDAATQKYIGTSAAAAAGIGIFAGGLLLIIGRLPAIIAGFSTMGAFLAGLPALLGAASAGFALLAASAFAYWKISNALKETGANTLENQLEDLNRVLAKQKKHIDLITEGLVYFDGIADTTGLTLADLGLKSEDLSAALRSNAAQNMNAIELIMLLRRRHEETTEEVEHATDKIKLYGNAIDEANTKMAKSLGIFDRYKQLIDQGKSSTVALRQAMKELAEGTGDAAGELERINAAAIAFLDVSDRLPTSLEKAVEAMNRMNAAAASLEFIKPVKEGDYDPALRRLVVAAEKASDDLQAIDIDAEPFTFGPIPEPEEFQEDVDRMKGWAIDTNKEIAADQNKWRQERKRDDAEDEKERQKILDEMVAANERAAEDVKRAWEKATTKIEGVFKDMFKRVFQDTKMAWERFWEDLGDLVVQEVADWAVGETIGRILDDLAPDSGRGRGGRGGGGLGETARDVATFKAGESVWDKLFGKQAAGMPAALPAGAGGGPLGPPSPVGPAALTQIASVALPVIAVAGNIWAGVKTITAFLRHRELERAIEAGEIVPRRRGGRRDLWAARAGGADVGVRRDGGGVTPFGGIGPGEIRIDKIEMNFAPGFQTMTQPEIDEMVSRQIAPAVGRAFSRDPRLRRSIMR